MSEEKPRRRGRPLGYKLSEQSKQAISESKFGHKHSEDTKDKISKSLLYFYKQKYPLSDEMLKTYHTRFGEDVASWVAANMDELDDLDDVLTDRFMLNTRRRELQFNSDFYKSKTTMDIDKLIEIKFILEEFGIKIKSTTKVYEVMLELIEDLDLYCIFDEVRIVVSD